jgi:hypothetical protein
MEFTAQYDNITECTPNGKKGNEGTSCNIDFIHVSDSKNDDDDFTTT